VATLVSGYSRVDTSDLDGISVGDARSVYSEPFGIPADARSTVGGRVVADDFVLTTGDTLVFDQPTGQKGVIFKVL
jgi:hypothetical protein